MKPKSPVLLVLGGLLFSIGAVLLLIWLPSGGRLLLGLGLGAVGLSAPLLALGGRWLPAREDPLETRRQRRLWKSGPLGRWWLSRRSRLP